MASAYSIARTYNEFVPPLDLELFYKGLQAKQTAYDQNFAFIQTQIDAAKSLDIVKQSDQKYAAERLGQIVEQVNNYGNIDLTSSSVARQVSSHVKQVLDDNVKNAISSTKEYRNFTQRMEELRKTNKAAYNQINEAYALRGFRNYLDNEEVGEVLKPINYSEYRDVQGKADKLLKEAFEMYGVQESQYSTGDLWTYLETKVQGIEKEKIRGFVMSRLDAADRQQMSINGWYNYSLESPEKAKAVMAEYTEKKNNTIDLQIKALENSKSNASSTEKEKIKQAITILNSQKEYNLESLKDIKSPERVGEFMEMEKMISGLEMMYSERIVSKKYTANQAYANKMRYNLDLKKFALDEKEFQFEKDKFTAEMLSKGFNTDGSIIPIDAIERMNLSDKAYIDGWNDIMSGSSSFDNEIKKVLEDNGIAVDESDSDYTEKALRELAKKDSEKAQELKEKSDVLNSKLLPIKTEINSMLKGYENMVGRENLLGYIKYQHDIADEDGKKMFEFIFEQAKRDYLKLEPKNTTPEQGIDNLKNMMGMGANNGQAALSVLMPLGKGANPYLNKDLYEGLGVHRDTKLENVRPYKKNIKHYTSITDIKNDLSSEAKFYKMFPSATKEDYTMYKNSKETLDNKKTNKIINRLTEERRKLSKKDIDTRIYKISSELAGSEKEKIEQAKKQLKKSFPSLNLTDEDLDILFNEKYLQHHSKDGNTEHYRKYKRRVELEDEIKSTSGDPTKFILKNIMGAAFKDENYRGIALRPEDLGGTAAEQIMRNELAAYLQTERFTAFGTIDQKKQINLYPADIGLNSFYVEQVDKDTKGKPTTFKTEAIPLENLPPSIQKQVISRRQKDIVIDGSYQVAADTEASQRTRTTIGNTILKLHKNNESLSNLNTEYINRMINKPESFSVIKIGNSLKLTDAKDKDDVVFDFKTENQDPNVVNESYLSYLYSPELVENALRRILVSINSGVIPKTLQK